MTTTVSTPTQALPTGRWQLDPTHSSASFAVKHMAVATFRGRFEDFDARLDVADDGNARFTGDVRADSVVMKDENLQAHLRSPEFFDTERYPQIRFESTGIRREGDELVVDGELTIKDQTRPVEARGEITGPAITLGDVEKIGVTLEAIVDRNEFGLDWNAPLPKGGVALANDVKLVVDLELVREAD